jgi:hypothetical protein
MKDKIMKAPPNTASVSRHWQPTKLNLTLSSVAFALLAFAGLNRADDGDYQRQAPPLPSPMCDSLDVSATNQVSSHVYASGVQIYQWSGTNWVFIAPEAALFADSCYFGQVGIHYAGPTWAANDGSKVVGTRLKGCTPDRGAIPWLLLGATPMSDYGRFSRLTSIQRVNTIGGTAPAEPGAFVGDEARVPYTAEYYFYRATR